MKFGGSTNCFNMKNCYVHYSTEFRNLHSFLPEVSKACYLWFVTLNWGFQPPVKLLHVCKMMSEVQSTPRIDSSICPARREASISWAKVSLLPFKRSKTQFLARVQEAIEVACRLKTCAKTLCAYSIYANQKKTC